MLSSNREEFSFEINQRIEMDLSEKSMEDNCYCARIINPQSPHHCQLCKKKISACLYVNELQHKISRQALEIESLKKTIKSYELEIKHQQLDYQALNNKYVASLNQVAQIQEQKYQADFEIEELSTKLFEEANVMVANERKKSIQLEKILQRTEDQLQIEQGQLRELKDRIESIVGIPQPKPVVCTSETNTKDTNLQINVTESNKHEKSHTKSLSVSSLSAFNTIDTETTKFAPENVTNDICSSKKICIDIGVLSIQLFKMYIDQFKNFKLTSVSGSTIGEHKSLIHVGSQPEVTKENEYIQLCEKEDIEPCLQFGVSTTRICTKTLMECMMQKPCYIESISLREARRIPSTTNSSAIYRPFWERFTANSSSSEDMYIECAACKRKFHILQYLDRKFYRFRLNEHDDWLLIDKSCRNRLVAVCDFYSFLRNIQLGHYQGRSLKDLYTENIHLKTQIFYSRI